MRDVNNGWLVRYLHSNTASAFFFLVYLHIGRGMYYGSYRAPRTLVWAIGTVSAPKGRYFGSVPRRLFKSGIDSIQFEYRMPLPGMWLITLSFGIAGGRCSMVRILFNLQLTASGIWHGKDNELDTIKHHRPRGNDHNRSCHHFDGVLRVIWLAHGETTTPSATSRRFNCCKCLNQKVTNLSLLRDRTAYAIGTRRRSFHTRGRVERPQQDSKGSSFNQEILETKVLEQRKAAGLTSSKVRKGGKRAALVTLVRKELQLYLDKRGSYNGLINILKNPEYLVACYESIRGKPGNMTKGSTKETLDGLTWEWFVKLGESLAKGKFDFTPARRVMIPKANGKLRPLGINSPREKIVQKALAVIMEQIWERIFLNSSHGFRPNRSIHSALKELYLEGGNYNWVIQGDIEKCFDAIPHSVIMNRVQKIIKCKRTLELIKKSLDAGYIDPDTKKTVNSDLGTPQGSVLSPLLCNIVLHDFDAFMSSMREEYNFGEKRRPNPDYVKLNSKRRYIRDIRERRKILREMRQLLASDPMDPNFKRLKYIRYADDFVILIIGPLGDAEKIKERIRDFLLNKCGLTLSLEKTVISNIQTEGFKFLGAECRRASMTKNHVVKHKDRTIRATTRLRVNIDLTKVYKKLVSIKVATWDNKNLQVPRGTANNALINFSHAEIISWYNSKIQGIQNFYSFAGNRKRLHLVFWILASSCALTLAKKHKMSSMGQIFKKFGRNLTCPETDVSLVRPSALEAIHDYKSNNVPDNLDFLDVTWAAKLTESNIGKSCFLCGSTKDIEMHHLKSVKDVKQKIRNGNASFSAWKGAFLRKQIPLCSYHHDLYHGGKLNYADLKQISSFTKLPDSPSDNK